MHVSVSVPIQNSCSVIIGYFGPVVYHIGCVGLARYDTGIFDISLLS